MAGFYVDRHIVQTDIDPLRLDGMGSLNTYFECELSYIDFEAPSNLRCMPKRTNQEFATQDEMEAMFMAMLKHNKLIENIRVSHICKAMNVLALASTQQRKLETYCMILKYMHGKDGMNIIDNVLYKVIVGNRFYDEDTMFWIQKYARESTTKPSQDQRATERVKLEKMKEIACKLVTILSCMHCYYSTLWLMKRIAATSRSDKDKLSVDFINASHAKCIHAIQRYKQAIQVNNQEDYWEVN